MINVQIDKIRGVKRYAENKSCEEEIASRQSGIQVVSSVVAIFDRNFDFLLSAFGRMVLFFFDYKPGKSLLDCNFVGLKWFAAPFNNPVLRDQFMRVMKNTLGINLLYMATMILPMIFAMFLMEIRWKGYRKLVQTLTTIPNFISWVLVYAAFLLCFPRKVC